jgi:hypothetical protein
VGKQEQAKHIQLSATAQKIIQILIFIEHLFVGWKEEYYLELWR